MINPDIILKSSAIAICLYFAIYNIIKGFRYPGNNLFALANLSGAGMLFINLYQIIYHDRTDPAGLNKYFFSLLILICQSIFAIIQIFPRWEKKPGAIFILLPQIPGFLLIGLTLSPDILPILPIKTVLNNSLSHAYAQLAFPYDIIFGLYIIGIFITFLYKSKHLENESFNIQLLSLQLGFIIGVAIPIIFYIVLPFYFNIYTYRNLGLLGIFFLQLVLNYSLSDERYIDFKKFYLRAVLRIAVIIMLLVSAYLFMAKIINLDLTQYNIPFFAVTAAILSFLFIFIYHILKPMADKLINKKDKAMQDIFNKISHNISELSHMRMQKMDWDNFFQKGINAVCEMLNIEKASFFLLNEESKVFEPAHSYNDNSRIAGINESDDIIISLNKNKQTIGKSLLYSNKELQEYKSVLLKFFNDNGIEAAVPVFSYTGKLIGLLLLGKPSDKKNYSIDFISFFESYRIQFSALLENLIFSEEIRRTQVIKRDKLVVKNIKKRIIPANFKDIEGLKISSLFINNSDSGGDYFDSIKIHSDKLGIYIANIADAGVESAMLALQMHSVFHSQADMHESPESLLNIVNQVLCGSRFTERYAAALYLIYNVSSRKIAFSNAAFNPLVIFNPNNESFAEFDAEGIPIGIDIGFHYKHETLTAPPGGIGLCYSQGISSAIDKDGNNYSLNRIKDIIRTNKNDAPAALIRKIYNDMKTFVGSELLNDITLIIFKTA